MLTLYYCPKTRSTRPMWLLEELGVPYEKVLINLSEKQHKQEDYLQIHPLGVVPALKDDDMILFESIGICLYLTDKFASHGFAPPIDSPERGQYYQWMSFVTGSLEPVLLDYLNKKEAGEEVVNKAIANIDTTVKIISNALVNKEYLVGNKLSTADLMIASGLAWAKMLKVVQFEDHLAAYVKGLMSRPAFQRVLAAS